MPEPRSKVAAFPMARLKFAGRLRRLADQMSSPGAPDAGDVIVIFVDRSGVINTESMMSTSVDRNLRMVGLLDAVRARFTDTFNYAARACEEESDA